MHQSLSSWFVYVSTSSTLEASHNDVDRDPEVGTTCVTFIWEGMALVFMASARTIIAKGTFAVISVIV
eukprot:263345-Prorocentrum_minimum.AAC.1